MRIVVVTGTSTGVGKTVVTAALARTAAAAGEQVVVAKPVQTGAATGDDDAATISRLGGCPAHTGVTLDEPLAPDTAARRAGVTPPRVAEHADEVAALARAYDTVLVEGAGGLLVRLDREGGTVLDLAAALPARVPAAEVAVVVVCAAGLGTLNHTELTVQALRGRGVEPSGLVLGAWPEHPGLAERCNREDLPRFTGVPLVGVLPAGAGELDPARFAETVLAPGCWPGGGSATVAGS